MADTPVKSKRYNYTKVPDEQFDNCFASLVRKFHDIRLVELAPDGPVPPGFTPCALEPKHHTRVATAFSLNGSQEVAQIAIHRLAMICKVRETDPAYQGKTTKLDASHLCNPRNKKRCCNPDHIVAESRQDNHSRKGCVAWRIIETADGRFWINTCTHEPKCITYDNKDIVALEANNAVNAADDE